MYIVTVITESLYPLHGLLSLFLTVIFDVGSSCLALIRLVSVCVEKPDSRRSISLACCLLVKARHDITMLNAVIKWNFEW